MTLHELQNKGKPSYWTQLGAALFLLIFIVPAFAVPHVMEFFRTSYPGHPETAAMMFVLASVSITYFLAQVYAVIVNRLERMYEDRFMRTMVKVQRKYPHIYADVQSSIAMMSAIIKEAGKDMGRSYKLLSEAAKDVRVNPKEDSPNSVASSAAGPTI